jgi:hypothetical protein
MWEGSSLWERKEKASDAGQRRGHQKQRGPAIEAFPGNHPEDRNEPREDADQTQ